MYKFPLMSFILLMVVMGSLVIPIVPVSNLGLRVSDIIILTIIPLLLLFKPSFSLSLFFKLYLGFIVVIMISTLHGYVRLGVPYSFSDINELIRMAMPLTVISAVFICDQDKLLNLMHKFLIYGAMYYIIIGLVQFINPFGLGYTIASWYSSGVHLESYLESDSARLFVTGTDPNVGAVIGSIFLFYNLNYFLFIRKPQYLVQSIFLLIIILLTASRTTILGILFSILLMFLFKRGIHLYVKILSLLTFATIGILIVPEIQYITVGIESVFRGENASINIRLENFKDAYELFIQSPLFGWGPAKSIHTTVVDGEYLLLLRRYGVVGTFIAIWYLLYTYIYIKRNIMTSFQFSKKAYILGQSLLSFLIVVSVVMLTNNFISGYQLFIPYTVLSSLVIFRLQNYKKRRKVDYYTT